MTDKKKSLHLPFWAVLAGSLLLSAALFFLCYQHDNKYTHPRPAAEQGIIRLNMEWYDQNSLFYLVDGWEFYQNQWLTPEEIPFHSPDAALYLGRYGGFDLGDPKADPHGSATYRMVLLTDGIEREYALELTEIFSRWQLWVNGQLMQSVGVDEAKAPAPDSRMVTFTAKDKIEIVVAVSDDSHFYSGMVYPPAFGSPREVGHISSVRLLLHTAAGSVALLIALLSLLVGAVYRFSQPYGALALLCLFFCGSTAWPVFQAMGLTDDFWPLLERFCYYGIFLALLWIQGRICGLSAKLFYPICGVGALVCLSVFLQPLIPVATAGGLMAYASILTMYKWLTAAWLLGSSLWALRRKTRYSKVLLAGSCIFACALAMDRILPLHEPIFLGWFVELAGVVLIFLTAGIAWYETVRVYRESLSLKVQKHLAEIQLEARSEQAKLQQEYVRRTRKQLHESRNQLTLIRHYAETRELTKLEGYIEGLLPKIEGFSSREYTGHNLTDAILSVQLARAAAGKIYVETDFKPLPSRLPLTDDEITALLMNMLDNAIEACTRLENPEERWISLRIAQEQQEFQLECSNAAPILPEADGVTSKADKQGHGFGLPLLKEIVRQYDGTVEIRRNEDDFHIFITINF